MQNKSEYRSLFSTSLEQQRLVLGETDLAICLSPGLWNPQLKKDLRDYLVQQRQALQSWIISQPNFAASHTPLPVTSLAPPLAQQMAAATALAGVGPMAAVAGAFAQAAAEYILQQYPKAEVIVENGGDIYLAGSQAKLVGVYAGEDNPFTGKLALQISKAQLPCSVCTSSGTVGHSFSYGLADAAIVVAKSAAVADAVATASGNLVHSADDLAKACDFAAAVPGVLGAVMIIGEALAAKGAVELKPLSQQ